MSPGQGLPVPVTPTPGGATFGHSNGHASAPLLAQLIAARLDVPQTRQLRRASPREAGRAYQSGAALQGPARAQRGKTL